MPQSETLLLLACNLHLGQQVVVLQVLLEIEQHKVCNINPTYQ